MMTVDALVANKLITGGPSVDDPPVQAAAGPPPVGLPGPMLMGVLGAGAWIGLTYATQQAPVVSMFAVGVLGLLQAGQRLQPH